MKTRYPTIALFLLIFLAVQLFTFLPVNKSGADDCLVPCDQIVSGGVSKDGIPAIDAPKFISAEEYDSSYGQATDLIIGVYFNGKARAYPAAILNWHEIVNDNYSGTSLSITYCPLTMSGIAFNTRAIGSSTLGTTGKLYENNLVFYDRQTDSYWSQMLGQGIKGEYRGEILSPIPIIQTTWIAWKSLYPETVVLSRETGYERDYDRNPYSKYQANLEIWFPTSYNSSRAPYNESQPKSHSFVLSLGNETRLFPYEAMNEYFIINEILGEKPVIIVNYKANILPMVFSATIRGVHHTFAPADADGLDITATLGLQLFRDMETGSIWNLRGEAIKGSLLGEQLVRLPAYNAFWFASTALFIPRNGSLFSPDNNDDFLYTEPINTKTGSSSASEDSLKDSSLLSTTSETGFSGISVLVIIGAVGIALFLVRRRRGSLHKKI